MTVLILVGREIFQGF